MKVPLNQTDEEGKDIVEDQDGQDNLAKEQELAKIGRPKNIPIKIKKFNNDERQLLRDNDASLN